MHDARVGDQVRVEGEEPYGKERRDRPVPRAGGGKHEEQQQREEQEERRPRRRGDRVGRDGTAEEEGVAVVREATSPSGTRAGGGGSGRAASARPASHLHQRRMLDVDDRRASGGHQLARQDVDRLVGREGVLARVVVDEKEGNGRREEGRRRRDARLQRRGLRRGSSVWRASAASAENPSFSRIFLPSARERPK